MQKLCCVRTRQHPLPVWSHKFVLSSTTHISTNSHPFLVGIVSDPQHPDVDERSFTKYDWTDFYRDADERVPSDMPPPQGHAVSTHCFVDSDHAGDKVTRRSQTGLLLFVNRAPWYGTASAKTQLKQAPSVANSSP